MKLSTIESTTDIEQLRQQVADLQNKYLELFGAQELAEDNSWPGVVEQLKTALLQAGKTDYNSIDSTMRSICRTNRCDVHQLHQEFVKGEGCTPDDWIAAQLSL
jgi:hypothetical protein